MLPAHDVGRIEFGVMGWALIKPRCIDGCRAETGQKSRERLAEHRRRCFGSDFRRCSVDASLAAYEPAHHMRATRAAAIIAANLSALYTHDNSKRPRLRGALQGVALGRSLGPEEQKTE